MSKRSAIFAIFLVTLAFATVDSSSASAGWFVGGTELKGSAALATTAQIQTASILTIPKLKGEITCEQAMALAAAAILAGQPEIAALLIFLFCTSPAQGCPLNPATATISTQPLVASVTKGPKAPEDWVNIRPRTKSLLATIPYAEKTTCAFEGNEPVSGSLTLRMPTGQSEETAQAIEGMGSFENNSLEVAGSKAYLGGGKILLKLASGSKWSFH